MSRRSIIIRRNCCGQSSFFSRWRAVRRRLDVAVKAVRLSHEPGSVPAARCRTERVQSLASRDRRSAQVSSVNDRSMVVKEQHSVYSAEPVHRQQNASRTPAVTRGRSIMVVSPSNGKGKTCQKRRQAATSSGQFVSAESRRRDRSRSLALTGVNNHGEDEAPPSSARPCSSMPTRTGQRSPERCTVSRRGVPGSQGSIASAGTPVPPFRRASPAVSP